MKKNPLLSESVMYLGIPLDKFKQLYHVTVKFNQASGILIKLSYKSSTKILKIVYYFFYDSYLLHVSQLFGQSKTEARDKFKNTKTKHCKTKASYTYC